MDRIRHAGFSPALAVAVVALLAAVAGTAVAGPGGPSANSAAKADKALKKAKQALKIAKETEKQQGPAGPAGPRGATGATGPAGADGTARAYARVIPNCPGNPQICAVDDVKGITAVTRVSTGVYCVIAPGISSDSVPAAVTVDWLQTADPEGNASAMDAPNVSCPLHEFGVITERHGAGTNAVVANDVSFTIVIP